ncbi:RNA methyltransferase [Clostridiaceae bacterium M8S5]|nr:RNA methyltransferase [Clostridiaceae bacterium M8S5]
MNSKAIGYKHPVIKNIKELKKGKRENNYRVVLEGTALHEKLLKTDAQIEELLVCKSLIETDIENDIKERCMKLAKQCYFVSEKIMSNICEKDKPQPLLSICYKQIPVLKEKKKSFKRVVILDGLETPGNIGSIFRSCDGAGIDAILVVNEKAKINQYKSIKSSMGGMISIPWFYFNSVKECYKWLQENEFKIMLADPYGKDVIENFNEEDRLAIVVGNERYGLSKEWIADIKVSIPMNGICDSLNVSIAASILIYQFRYNN